MPAPAPAPPPMAPEKPALTPSEQTYLTTTGDQWKTIGIAFLRLKGLLQNPQIGDDQWISKVAALLVTMQIVYNEATQLDPPTSMAEIHLNHIKAMKHYNDATYLIARGFDELDPSLIDKATEEMLTGEKLIEETTYIIAFAISSCLF